MQTPSRCIWPVLPSAGPGNNFLALAFEGESRSVWLSDTISQDDAPDHPGQRAVDAALARFVDRPSRVVCTDLPPEQWQEPAWQIPLVFGALALLRDNLTGLAQALGIDAMRAIAGEVGLSISAAQNPLLRCALDGNITARTHRRGTSIALHTPQAAMIWLRVDHVLSKSAWNAAQRTAISHKEHAARAERMASAMLRAACEPSLAVFEAFEAATPPSSLLQAIPGWLPAQNAVRTLAKSLQSPVYTALIGPGPDMLIAAGQDIDAATCARTAQQTFSSHTIPTTISAWSTIDPTL